MLLSIAVCKGRGIDRGGADQAIICSPRRELSLVLGSVRQRQSVLARSRLRNLVRKVRSGPAMRQVVLVSMARSAAR